MNNFVAFLAGVGIGSVVTWAVVKSKYEQIAQEEIDSVKEAFSDRKRVKVEPIDEPVDEEETEKDEYEKLTTNYKTYSKKKGDSEEMLEPYVISPDDFDAEDYDTNSFTYYADGVLTDDKDNPMDEDEIERTVGQDSLTHFGEFEDDSVFVRNDELKTDYEILLVNDKYYDSPDTEE